MPLACLSKPLVFRFNIAKRCPYIIKFPQFDTPWLMDYSNLLALTGYITQSQEDVEQMYRRMLFNYLTENKDDHCKNFSFYVVKDPDTGAWRWRLAPAYDLTLCSEGYNGEHATSVNGTGHPTLSDFLAVGTNIKLSEPRCLTIIEEVRIAAASILRHDISK